MHVGRLYYRIAQHGSVMQVWEQCAASRVNEIFFNEASKFDS